MEYNEFSRLMFSRLEPVDPSAISVYELKFKELYKRSEHKSLTPRDVENMSIGFRLGATFVEERSRWVMDQTSIR